MFVSFLRYFRRSFPISDNMNVSVRWNAFHKGSKRQKPQETCLGLLSQMLSEKGPKGSANICHLRTSALPFAGGLFIPIVTTTINTITPHGSILFGREYRCFCIGCRSITIEGETLHPKGCAPLPWVFKKLRVFCVLKWCHARLYLLINIVSIVNAVGPSQLESFSTSRRRRRSFTDIIVNMVQ